MRNISIGYPGRVLVSGLNYEFADGTLTALVGRNGSGKSTLLRTIAGLARPLSGDVLVNGRSLSKLLPRESAQTVSLVTTERIRVTNLRAGDVVALGRMPYTDWLGRLTDADRTAVDRALELVGMSDFASARMDTLSDGEAQRVMIARAAAQDTPVILLDEPTAFLDFAARREVCELLRELARGEGKTIVFSSHELALVDEFADGQLRL